MHRAYNLKALTEDLRCKSVRTVTYMDKGMAYTTASSKALCMDTVGM